MSSEKNLLNELNAQLQEKIVTTVQAVNGRRSANAPVAWRDYLLAALTERIAHVLAIAPADLDLSFVDTAKFKADLALRIPALLKTKPTPVYIKEDVPRFAAALETLREEHLLEKIEAKGIYLNLTCTTPFLLAAIEQVVTLGDRYGTSDFFSKRKFVVDYSSPNVGKHLHAGHIRGTIIGHVLCNLYEAIGGTAYRFNYINDWGGFGELMEAYERFGTLRDPSIQENAAVYFCYKMYREAEKAASSPAEFAQVSADKKEVLQCAFPGALETYEAFNAAFVEFKIAAKNRFADLEAGKSAEVTLWQTMVRWSLADFERFYSFVNIHQDFLIGESFYVSMGRQIVEDGLANGTVLKFTPEEAKKALDALVSDLEKEKVTEDEFKVYEAEIQRDIGAYVVPINERRRMVVQRADGATIYATRDIAGVKHRTETFDATDLIYEVGQEQSDHFATLFEASKKLRLTGDKDVRFEHIYHGFYIDSTTKKKLSSREGASGVLALFSDAEQYFFEKYEGSSEFSIEEKKAIAHTLAVGSVVYNDLKRDKKLPVELNPDRRKMVEEFEKAGGAYVVYSVCRARSILRKAGVPPPRGSELAQATLEPIERELLKLVIDFPRRVHHAARNENPSALIGFLEEAASLYNRYYHDYPVIKGGERNLYRLSITAAVAKMIENGLAMCHIFCPEKI